MLGIDLIGDYCSIAHLGPAGPAVLRVGEQIVRIPMAVALADNKVVAGERALEQIKRYPNSGRTDFLPDILKDYVLDCDEQKITTLDALEALFHYIAAVARDAKQMVNVPTVITVPAYFNDVQRARVKDSAIKTGFQVFRLVNRPTAFVLSYWFQNKKTVKRYLVCEVEDDQTEITIVHMQEEYPEIEVSNAILPNQDAAKCLRGVLKDALLLPDAVEAILITQNNTALINTCKTIFAKDPIVLTHGTDHAAMGAAIFAALSRKQSAPLSQQQQLSPQSTIPEAAQRSGCLFAFLIVFGSIACGAALLLK